MVTTVGWSMYYFSDTNVCTSVQGPQWLLSIGLLYKVIYTPTHIRTYEAHKAPQKVKT